MLNSNNLIVQVLRQIAIYICCTHDCPFVIYNLRV